MKRLLLLGVGSALMFTMGGVGPANADAGPHQSHAVQNGQTGVLISLSGGGCASCHRAHTAKAENLLKDTQPALCYTCHGGSAATLDVIDGVEGSGLPLRGGGFEYSLINGAGATKSISSTGTKTVTAPYTSTPQIVTSRHQIDGTTTGTMWGNGAISDTVNPGQAGVTLECGSCHDPHGNGNYRILKPIPNDAGTQAADVLTPHADAYTDSKGVFHAEVLEVLRPSTGINIPDAVVKNYTTVDYWLVADRQVPTTKGSTTLPVAGETDGYIANVSAWCTTCHTRYYANSGSAGVSSGDALFTYRHASAKTDKEGLSRPNCIQCHVAHGTSAVMNGYSAPFVNAPDGAIPTAKGGVATPYIDHAKVAQAGLSGTPVGTSRLLRVDNRGTCVMCHNK